MFNFHQSDSTVLRPQGEGAGVPRDAVIPPKGSASSIPFVSSGAAAPSFRAAQRPDPPTTTFTPRSRPSPPTYQYYRCTSPTASHPSIPLPRPFTSRKACIFRQRRCRQAKQEEKAAERAAKEAKKAADKEAREAKKQAEKAAKEAQKLADKQAKEAERAAAKEKARKRPNPPRGRRDPGDSDDEIGRANPGDIKQATIRPIAREKQSQKWTDEESLKAIQHILSAAVWPRFKVRQTIVFEEISEAILLGSKDWKQVANFWQTCWKKVKACRRRENHTGGGDGDKLIIDDVHEEVGSELEHEGAVSEDETGPAVKKEPQDSAQAAFTNAQLDRSEETEIYKLLLDVAGNHPEVVKDEEFDSSRPLSDSEDETSSRRHLRWETSVQDKIANTGIYITPNG
ncbi:hypothetical protein B0J17DRAFT_723005 [Rhizoctonia solani]|nr:hypothetical protein B0J17DRAFT_723005 [Rhizoctonia solani]